LLVATLGGSFSGGLLAWDQVALWAVTVGADFKGFTKIVSGDNVRSVIIGSKEISTGAFTTWFWVHTVVIPVVVLALGIALLRGGRARVDEDEPVRAGVAPDVHEDATAGNAGLRRAGGTERGR
jgi:hypothetical protein